MNENNDRLCEHYWNLLNDVIDYTETGYRRPRSNFVSICSNSGSADGVWIEGDVGNGASSGLSREEALQEIKEEIACCEKCILSQGRTNTVPGYGVLGPFVMCVGEAPGADEDKTGKPFVGRAGQYLDKWLHAINLSRDTNCFIGNIIKCRPPNNRDPRPEEMEVCLPFLQRQIELIKPKTILTLGRISSQVLSGSSKGIGALRGETFDYMGIPCIPTYHPSGVLRNPEYRQPVWDDLRRLKELFSNA